MNLRAALDLCSSENADDWLEMPGNRPATAMLAGIFDAGMEQAQSRPLAGHSVAVFEPDARLSLVWPVPEDDRSTLHQFEQPGLPEWAENGTDQWKHARRDWAVILISGAPIWQEPVWYLDWGSGIGGYVADFQPVFSDDTANRELQGWEATTWQIGLAGLINSFGTPEFLSHDPTERIVPSPSSTHPVDSRRVDW